MNKIANNKLMAALVVILLISLAMLGYLGYSVNYYVNKVQSYDLQGQNRQSIIEEYVKSQVASQVLLEADDEWNFVIGIGRDKMKIDPDGYFYCQRYWLYQEEQLLIMGPCRDAPHVFIFKEPAFVFIIARWEQVEPIEWPTK